MDSKTRGAQPTGSYSEGKDEDVRLNMSNRWLGCVLIVSTRICQRLLLMVMMVLVPLHSKVL